MEEIKKASLDVRIELADIVNVKVNGDGTYSSINAARATWEHASAGMFGKLLRDLDEKEKEKLNSYSDDEIRVEVMKEIEEYALPFLDKYDDWDVVKKVLESTQPPYDDPFPLDSVDRICKLAIMEHMEGNKNKAIKMIDKALKEKDAKLPAPQWILQKVRKKLK